MIGLYFSGTGNSKYCVEYFLKEYGTNAQAVSIEEADAADKAQGHAEIVMGYPVQYSGIPKILNDFIAANQTAWRGRKIFLIATMGLFSGDGTGVSARLLKAYGADVTGGLHLKMPDSICDESVLKRSLRENQILVRNAESKIKKAVRNFKSGRPPQEGLGFFCHLAGLFGQRLYFYHKTKSYTDKIKINTERCTGCGKCADLCPMKNIYLDKQKAIAGSQCTMCYRCISRCPAQAITLLGRRVIEQCRIEKYL